MILMNLLRHVPLLCCRCRSSGASRVQMTKPRLGVPLQDRKAKSCCSGIRFHSVIVLAEPYMPCILLTSRTLEDFLFSRSVVQASRLTFEAVLNVSLHKSQSSSTNLRQLFSVFDSLLTLFLLRLLLVILISLLMILSLLFNVKLRGSMRPYTATVFVMLGPLPDATLRFIYLSHFIAFPMFQQCCLPPRYYCGADILSIRSCPLQPPPKYVTFHVGDSLKYTKSSVSSRIFSIRF